MDLMKFRKVAGHFASGVTVVTIAKSHSSFHGVTVNAFCSLSLEPPLLIICLYKESQSCKLVQECGYFAINILSEQQESIAQYFARKEKHKILGTEEMLVDFVQEKIPVLRSSMAYLTCQLVHEYTIGDHTIFIGQVLDCQFKDKQLPLVFFKGQFTKINK